VNSFLLAAAEGSSKQALPDEESGEYRISLRRRNLKGKKKFCPRCFNQMSVFGELSGWLLPEEYLCEKCGYVGYVAFEQLPEDDIEKE